MVGVWLDQFESGIEESFGMVGSVATERVGVGCVVHLDSHEMNGVYAKF